MENMEKRVYLAGIPSVRDKHVRASHYPSFLGSFSPPIAQNLFALLQAFMCLSQISE